MASLFLYNSCECDYAALHGIGLGYVSYLDDIFLHETVNLFETHRDNVLISPKRKI